MCGIFAVVYDKGFKLGEQDVDLLDTDASLMQNRGTTSRKFILNNKVYMRHNRLPIMDLSSRGAQPFFYDGIMCMVNGEIYNSEEIKEELAYTPRSTSNSELIIPLYLKYGTSFVNHIRGMFSFVLLDVKRSLLLASRDHIGMTSLYLANSDSVMVISSDMKCTLRLAKEYNMEVRHFKPNHVLIHTFGKNKLHQEFPLAPHSWMLEGFTFSSSTREAISQELSILLSKIIAEHSRKQPSVSAIILDDGTVGASCIKSILQSIPSFRPSQYTADQCVQVLEDVVKCIESYEPNVVRRGLNAYLNSKAIKETQSSTRVVIKPDICDILFGIVSEDLTSIEIHNNAIQAISNLHDRDCLAMHKAYIAHGIEARIPFGDKSLMEFAMRIPPNFKKHDNIMQELYPAQNPLVQNIQNHMLVHANAVVSDEDFQNRSTRFQENTPSTKEEYLYRSIFDRVFPDVTINRD